MELDDLERRLDVAATRLGRAATRLAALDPGARAFGGDGPGRLGDLGRALSAQFAGALDTRDWQARSAATAIHNLSEGMRRAAAGYRDADANRGGAAHGGS